MKRLVLFSIIAAICLSLCGCRLKDSVYFELPRGEVYEQKDIYHLYFIARSPDGGTFHDWDTEDPELILEFIEMLEGLSFEKPESMHPSTSGYIIEFSLFNRPDENGVSTGGPRVDYVYSDELEKPVLLWVSGTRYYYTITDGYWSEEEWLDFLGRCEDLGSRELVWPETIDVLTPDGWVTKPFGSDYPIGSVAEDGLLHGIDIDFAEAETLRLKDINKIAYRISNTIKADYITEDPELISELLTMLSETDFGEPIIGNPETESTIKFSSNDSRIPIFISIEDGIFGNIWSKQHGSNVYYRAVSGFWSAEEWEDFFSRCEG